MRIKTFTPFEDKFEPITETGCWVWIAGSTRTGYGRHYVNGTTVYAHRHAYELWIGPIPNGLYVLHKCDNPSCVNPQHLFVGSHLDNVADMIAKGRNSGNHKGVGEANGRSKLSAPEVKSIRQRYKNGESQTALSREFDLGVTAINKVVTYKTWKHLP